MKCNRLITLSLVCLVVISFVLSPHLAFARRVKEDRWIPMEELGGKILVNKDTGRIKFSGEDPAAKINFTFWVVRHGETEGNITKEMFQGAVDESINQLTEKGKEQAREAAAILFNDLEDKIKNGEEIVVITSEFGRAKETAAAFIDLVNKETGITLEPMVEALANEISFGEFDNRTPEQLSSEQRSLVLRYRERLDAVVRYPNGESFLDLLSRAKELLHELNRLYKCKTVIMFSHGTLLSAVRTLLGDAKLLDESGQIDWRNKMLLPGESRCLFSYNPI